jgi:uncharacterized protein (TIGR00297 family)
VALATAAALVAALAATAYALGIIAASGALAGASVSFAILLGAGLPGFIILLAFYPAATYAAHAISSLIHAKRKGQNLLSALSPRKLHGIRRDGRQVLANGGVPAMLALLHLLSAGTPPILSGGWTFVTAPSIWLTAMTAALTSAAADTASHEIGEAVGGKTYSPFSRRVVPPGTTGAISFDGSAAALCVIFAFTALAYILHVTPTVLSTLPVVIGAVAGNLADTFIGAGIEARSKLWGNNATNLAASIVAAGVAVLCALCVR